MTEGPNLRTTSERIEALVADLATLGDSRARAVAEELLRLLMETYGAGLARMLALAREDGAAGEMLVGRYAADNLIASLLILHGLHPLDTGTRVERALDRVRPYLGSHGGGVEVLGITGDTLQLRLDGSCHGCPSSALTMRLAVENAIREAAPEIGRIDVEGLRAEQPDLQWIRFQPDGGRHAGDRRHAGTVPGTPSSVDREHRDGDPALVLPTGGIPTGAAAHGRVDWVSLADIPELRAGEVADVKADGVPIVICRVGEMLYAYRDRCAACGHAIGPGALREEILECPDCGHTYDVRRAGRSLDGADLHLDPLPLLSERDHLAVAVDAGRWA